jgi:arylsulfatase A-like enzyme
MLLRMKFGFAVTAMLLAGAMLRSAQPEAAFGNAQAEPLSSQPRLLLILVVDQMRADYLDTFRHRWRAGLATLLRDGAVFERAEYPYSNTVTCPGHATIGTGTFPHRHGMVLNTWWDRDRRVAVACTDDPASATMSYGRPAKGGASGHLLRASTFAETLRTARASSRVVSLSLKPRSAIGLVGRHATVVTWADDVSASFATSRAFASAPVESVRRFLIDVPYAADLKMTWTLAAPDESYRYPDANALARPPATQTGLFPHSFPSTARPETSFALWQASPWSDAYLSRMATRMIDDYRLGQRQDTDVLAVSFSALDLIGHAYGPESREIEDALLRLDATIGTLIDKLDASVGRRNYLLAFTSDHGVANIPQASGAGRVAAQDIRERVEETLRRHFGRRDGDHPDYVANVTFTNVYLADGVWARLRQDDKTWRATERAVLDLPGVARLLRSDRLDPRSSDPDVRAAALSFVPDRSGDLIVVTKPRWTVGPRTESAATTHGTAHLYDRHVPMILLGSDVKAGSRHEAVSPADIAPTLAWVAGVTMKGVEGRPLREAFASLTREAPPQTGEHVKPAAAPPRDLSLIPSPAASGARPMARR